MLFRILYFKNCPCAICPPFASFHINFIRALQVSKKLPLRSRQNGTSNPDFCLGLFYVNPLDPWWVRSDPSNINPYNNQFGCRIFVKFWLRSLKVARNLKTSHLIGLEKDKHCIFIFIFQHWYFSLDFPLFPSLPFLRYFHK